MLGGGIRWFSMVVGTVIDRSPWDPTVNLWDGICRNERAGEGRTTVFSPACASVSVLLGPVRCYHNRIAIHGDIPSEGSYD